MAQHIAFIVNSYPPYPGGLERHIHALAQALTARGVRCTVVTLGEKPGETDEHGVAVIRLPRRLRIGDVLSFPRFGTSRYLRRLLRERGVTVVSTHTRFFPLTWLGVAAGRRASIPVVHTEHGSGFVKGVSPLVALASRLVDVTLGRYSLRRATRVLAVSDAVARFVRRLAGVPATRFYNAIDLEQWRHEGPAPRAKRFVFLGRLVPGKGWDTLLDAFAANAAAGESEWSVDILGDGPARAAVESRIARLGLRERVRVHGHVEGPRLREILMGATLVNPTTLSEGFQTSLIEALARRARVVTFDVPGARELKDDGAPVWIVEAVNAEALAAAMRSAADADVPDYPDDRLEAWGWERRASQYVAILDELSPPSGPAAPAPAR